MKTELSKKSINGCHWVIETQQTESGWIVKAFRGGIKRYEASHKSQMTATLILSDTILRSAI